MSCVVIIAKLSGVSHDHGPNIWLPSFRNCHGKRIHRGKLYSGLIPTLSFPCDWRVIWHHQASASSQGNPEKYLSLGSTWSERPEKTPSPQEMLGALYSGAITFLWAQLITQKPLAYWHFHQNVTSLGKNLQIPHVFPSRDQTLLTTGPSQKVLSLSLAFLWNERISFFFSCFSHCMIQ